MDGQDCAELKTRRPSRVRRAPRRLLSLALQAHGYEHQYPMASVCELIWPHLLGPGLPVVPHARQSQ